MADLMKKKSFIRGGEGSVASYNWTDIGEGTGMVNFYGMLTNTLGTSDTPKLTQTTGYSSEVYLNGLLDTPADNAVFIDADFDLSPFNLPKVMGGTALFRCSFSYAHTFGGGSSGYGNLKIIIRKVSGGVETDLVSEESDQVGLTGTTGTAYARCVMPLVIPLTSFKKGDTLRVTVQALSYGGASGGNEAMRIWCDPLNATITSVPFTQMKVEIPFRIDL